MKHKDFDLKVKDYIGKYNPGNNGVWIYKGEKRFYKHVLKLPENCTKEKKEEIVKESNIMEAASKKPFLLKNKLHPEAHHLNSSQIMCYNFFRPLISDDLKPIPELIDILHNFCPKLNSSNLSECRFEYKEKDCDDTNFDFYVKNGDIKIYFEIKYTEGNFKKSGGGNDPQSTFENKYKPKLKDFLNSKVDKNEYYQFAMEKYYQLLRNSLRAKDENSYVLFVCPSDRTDLQESFNEFKRCIKPKYYDRIQYVFWEQLIVFAESEGFDESSFCKKYFGYFKSKI